MKPAFLALLASQLAIIAGFWWWNHAHHQFGNQLTGDLTGQLLAWGRLAGLLAAFGCLLQIVLVGRVRWVERVFGLDRLSRLHHYVGFALLAAILAHPVLVTVGHARQADVSLGAQLADFVGKWEDVGSALVAAAIMVLALGFSVLVVMKRIGYEFWHATHLALYVALALAFGHQISVGWDLTSNPWFRGYWIALYLFVGVNLVWYRWGRQLLDYARHRFAVERVVPEPGGVTSVCIGGRDLERFRVRAGQFMIVRFLAKGFRWEAHPFSMSCWPDGKGLRLSIKALGDYTRKIPSLPVGTKVVVDGPHGVFTAERCRGEKALLVAGGIGITPLRSLAEELLRRGKDIVLVYGNRSAASVVFREELDALAAAHPGRFAVVHVMSADPGWPGERGSVDRERLARLVPDLRERDVFLCGPPPMMKGVRAALRGLGVPKGRIHWERFAL